MKLHLPKKAVPPAGRNRRPADRQSPSAFSYHANRAERPEQPGRQQFSLADKRRRILSLHFWAKRSGAVIVTLIVIVCLISIVSLSSSPKIVLLGNNGYALHSTSTYQAAAAKDLSASIWNRNKITVNTGAASSRLLKQFPELASVTITLPLIGHRPIYYIRTNPPAFVMQAVNGSYVLDASGKSLAPKVDVSADKVASLPVITDQTGVHVQPGHQVISSDNAVFISTVLAELKTKQVSVSSIDLPPNAAQEVDMHIAGQPYYVKFNMHTVSAAREQAGTYLATINNLAGQHIMPSQYIDVRVAGRAYYQ